MTWAGAYQESFKTAEESIGRLGELSISAGRIRRVIEQIGGERVEERDTAVERYKRMDIPKQDAGSSAVEPPEIGVISADGGRYQRRDYFGEKNRPPGRKHWREDKVGCLLSMTGPSYESDPVPKLPEWLKVSSAIAEMAKIAEKTGNLEDSINLETEDRDLREEEEFPSPNLVSREVLASGEDWESFGWQLAARAWQHGFPGAKRLAFVADGAAINWAIHRQHFSNAVPVLDLMHALAYGYSAAKAVGGDVYPQWAQWIWAGEVDRVIAALRAHQERLGRPPDDAGEADPRKRVDRALVYYTNQRTRMDYPKYRRLGLPLTSSNIESTVKQVNRRVKGTEKFWLGPTSEAILQLRADYLSSSEPLDRFWIRYHARQTGSNAYKQAS